MILKGLINTDGSMGNELVFDSTSYNLIEAVRFICLKLGVLTGGYERDRIGESHITKYGDILGFDLVSGADEGHTYKWVDRYGGPSVLTSTHDPQKKAWLLYKDLAEKGKYGLSRGDLYQIVHWQKRIKQKYTE